MAENPLLPNEELRRLYRLLKQASPTPAKAAKFAKSAKTSVPSDQQPGDLAALVVACSMQLREADALVLPAALTSSQGAVPAWHGHALPPAVVPQGVSSFLAAAAIASAQAARADHPIVLTIANSSHPDNAWKAALQWAQEQKLPLVVALVDPSGPESMRRTSPGSGGIGWAALDRLCHQLQLPILTVDGADAIASYRVMQESALRARAGGGPAVLWAVLPHPDSPSVETPLTHLTRYMKVRRIALR